METGKFIHSLWLLTYNLDPPTKPLVTQRTHLVPDHNPGLSDESAQSRLSIKCLPRFRMSPHTCCSDLSTPGLPGNFLACSIAYQALLAGIVYTTMSESVDYARSRHGRAQFASQAPPCSGSETDTADTPASNAWGAGKGQFSLQSLQATAV